MHIEVSWYVCAGTGVWSEDLTDSNRNLPSTCSPIYSHAGQGCQHSKPLLQVKDDDELLKWYQEIQTEGHPDAKDVNGDCWIELKDISSLVHILATMAWVG